MALKDRIREARDEAGLTQEQFAPRIGVTLATISRWERGKGEPSVRKLAAIAGATGKPMRFFLEEEVAA